VADFVAVFRRPRSFASGILVQLLVLPWVAVGIAAAAGLDEGIAVGLVLISAMPGGALSKVLTYVGRGNAALSISLTTFTTLVSVVTVPALLQLLVARYISADFAMPFGDVLLELILFLLLPLLVGMAIGHRWPAWGKQVTRWCARAGLIVVAVMIAGAVGSDRIRALDYGWNTPVAIVLFCVLGQQLSMLPFYLFGGPRADRMAVGIEVTMRNINLALLLKARLFPEGHPRSGGVLFVILFYAAVALGAGLPLALNHRRLAQREALRDAQREAQPDAAAGAVPDLSPE
jgi:BASS family bile acid:Na+ symporter